jgi:hypothetical protein
MNTKFEANFVAHNLDTEFALFGVRTWEIWRRQGRAVNQENLDEVDFMETKFASLPRRISSKARWSTPTTKNLVVYDGKFSSRIIKIST